MIRNLELTKIKNIFEYEKYLDNLGINQRKAMARLRISAHRLPIEVGRYCRPYIPAEERVCLECPNQIGDETHFLVKCAKFAEQREPLFSQIEEKYPNFNTLNEDQKFIFLMTVEGNLQKDVARFIEQNL